MVLSQCPLCAEHQALCCDGTGELRGALPLPGLCLGAGIYISAAGGFFPAHTGCICISLVVSALTGMLVFSWSAVIQ